MLFAYPAIFHKDNGAYWVEFPDLKGCQSFGDDVNDTAANAREALAAYLLTLLEEGAQLAKPSDIGVAAAPSDGFVSLVSCDIDPHVETKAAKRLSGFRCGSTIADTNALDVPDVAMKSLVSVDMAQVRSAWNTRSVRRAVTKQNGAGQTA